MMTRKLLTSTAILFTLLLTIGTLEAQLTKGKLYSNEFEASFNFTNCTSAGNCDDLNPNTIDSCITNYCVNYDTNSNFGDTSVALGMCVRSENDFYVYFANDTIINYRNGVKTKIAVPYPSSLSWGTDYWVETMHYSNHHGLIILYGRKGNLVTYKNGIWADWGSVGSQWEHKIDVAETENGNFYFTTHNTISGTRLHLFNGVSHKIVSIPNAFLEGVNNSLDTWKNTLYIASFSSPDTTAFMTFDGSVWKSYNTTNTPLTSNKYSNIAVVDSMNIYLSDWNFSNIVHLNGGVVSTLPAITNSYYTGKQMIVDASSKLWLTYHKTAGAPWQIIHNTLSYYDGSIWVEYNNQTMGFRSTNGPTGPPHYDMDSIVFHPDTSGNLHFSLRAQIGNHNPQRTLLINQSDLISDSLDVWPGDANSNGIANATDILNIGIGYGYNGSSRPFASTAWVGQYCPNWVDTFITGINYHHADCNGDGIINFLDAGAILTNYGLTHSKSNSGVSSGQIPLSMEFARDTFNIGDTVTGQILFGDSVTPADSVYGLAFSIHHNQFLVDSSSIMLEFGSTWFADTSNSISITKNLFSQSKIDGGYTRTDHANVSGFGSIGTVSFVIQDNINGKTLSELRTIDMLFSDVTVVNSKGEIITANYQPKPLYIIDPIDEEIRSYIYPNPVKNEFYIANVDDLTSYTVYDLTGKIVIPETQINSAKTAVKTHDLANGIFLVRLKDADGNVKNLKVVKSN